MLIEVLDVRELSERAELLRPLTLDPSKDYQETRLPPVVRRGGISAATSERRLPCAEISAHDVPRYHTVLLTRCFSNFRSLCEILPEGRTRVKAELFQSF